LNVASGSNSDSGSKRRRFANGPRRPQYLTAADVDKSVMMILALAAEVSALRERLDTHERLADCGSLPKTASVENYVPSDEVESTRASLRHSLIDRVTRLLLDTGAERKPTTARHGE